MQVQFSQFLPIQLYINYIKNLTLLKKFDIINIQTEKEFVKVWFRYLTMDNPVRG